MALIISGHQRSGTTILQELCDGHPELSVTNEFANFAYLGRSYVEHSCRVMLRWCRVHRKWAFNRSCVSSDSKGLCNLVFTIRYLLEVFRHYPVPINVRVVEAALKRAFPDSSIVGDKWPSYMFLMDKFVDRDDLRRLVIYRDCRDVTSSFLEQVRTTWRERAWIKNFDTAEKIARQWVDVIGLMERHAGRLHVVRYEDMIDDPKTVFASIGDWLDVDPAGFPTQAINAAGIGKYRNGLTRKELATVMDIAAPTMTRLGYI